MLNKKKIKFFEIQTIFFAFVKIKIRATSFVQKPFCRQAFGRHKHSIKQRFFDQKTGSQLCRSDAVSSNVF